MIIGIKGLKDSGKTTVAKYLTRQYGFVEKYFSHPLKQIICILTGWDFDYVNGATPEYKAARETEKHSDYDLTCRELLQQVGTDLFRNEFNQDVWVKIMRRHLTRGDAAAENVLFSDLRFPNECALVQELDGIIIRLVRGTPVKQLTWYQRDMKALSPRAFHLMWPELTVVDSHESEEIFDTKDEIIVYNNGTLEELYQQIDAIVMSAHLTAASGFREAKIDVSRNPLFDGGGTVPPTPAPSPAVGFIRK